MTVHTAQVSDFLGLSISNTVYTLIRHVLSCCFAACIQDITT